MQQLHAILRDPDMSTETTARDTLGTDPVDPREHVRVPILDGAS